MPVRIYDIAKKLGIHSKEVLAKAKEYSEDMGIGFGWRTVAEPPNNEPPQGPAARDHLR